MAVESVRLTTLDSVKTVLSFKGLNAAVGFGDKVNKLIKTIFPHLKEGCDKADGFFKVGVSDFFGILKNLEFWLENKKRSIEEKVSQVFLTFRNAIGSVEFLGKQGVINLAKVAVKVGRLPVLSLVTGGLSLVAGAFSLTNDLEKYKQIKVKLVDLRRNSDSNAREIGIEERELHSKKLSIIQNIAAIAFQILLIAGMASGVGFLAGTGLFLVSFAVVNASMSLYGSYLTIRNDRLKSPQAA